MDEGLQRLRADKVVLGTTRWSLVRRATACGEALDEWVTSCWYPLYAWARRKDWSPEDAADAVQEFLGKICAKGSLAQVDPARGKFRTWLLTAFGNHLTSQRSNSRRIKRGGAVVHLPLDIDGMEILFQEDMAAVTDPTQVYTRAWALSLMDEALTRLADHFTAGGREQLFAALLPALEAPLADTTYQEVAARLGLSAGALRQAALRFRQRYRRLLLDVAAERLGITCEVRLGEELRELLGG
jgi:RNA polymerase sigma-70 factor (ECF subfamily)